MKIRILHVITGLNVGGAEMMLYKLVSHMQPQVFQNDIVSLVELGSVSARIQDHGIRVRSLGMRRGLPDPTKVWQLARWMRKDVPCVVQTWMYHADLLGGLAARLAGHAPVVWNVRHSNLDRRVNSSSTVATVRVCARLSHVLPSAIVCNSHASRTVHDQLGYADSAMQVIPNGFDVNHFRPDEQARISVREELNIPLDAHIVGMAARFDPQKNYRGFIEAAALCRRDLPNVHFVLLGEGVSWQNAELRNWIRQASLHGRCHLLGPRNDVARLMAAADIMTLSSLAGESFPNVVGEAMACGVPCVVTNVGDAGVIVGRTGIVVPPEAPLQLSQAWQQLLGMRRQERIHLGTLARQRISESYSIEAVVKQYENLYLSLA